MERQIEPNIVVLRSSTWVTELAYEFRTDPALVVKHLQHILGRAGWPQETHQVADYAEPSEQSRSLMQEPPDATQ